MDLRAVDSSSGSSLYGLSVPVMPLCPCFEEDEISLAKTTRFSSPYLYGRAIHRNRIASMYARDVFSGLRPKWCLSFVYHSGIHRDGAALALFSRDSCESPFPSTIFLSFRRNVRSARSLLPPRQSRASATRKPRRQPPLRVTPAVSLGVLFLDHLRGFALPGRHSIGASADGRDVLA